MTEFQKEKAFEYYQELGNISEAARAHCEEIGIPYGEKYRNRLSRYIRSSNRADLNNVTETTTVQYNSPTKTQFSAIGADDEMMDIKAYCKYYSLPVEKIRSYKLVSHTAVPYYNIAFYEEVITPSLSMEEMKDAIKSELTNIKGRHRTYTYGKGVGVIKIADLHVGALINKLLRTKDFSLGILSDMLVQAAEEVNKRGFAVVHVHILGDIIESFTGLNHKNVWKSMDPNIVGAQAIITATEVLDLYFLSRIDNLQDIKVVAGNHDRVTSDKKEDDRGDGAELVSWALRLKGYDVEYNCLVISHTVDNITHILTHGHHGISKKTTKQMCWDYGVQGNYNLICEGHLHSIIEHLPIKMREKFQVAKDDAVDHRRIVCPSFFPGNFYSESCGWTTTPGFMIVEDNGKGVPNISYYAL
jgi:hypothetical protein